MVRKRLVAAVDLHEAQRRHDLLATRVRIAERRNQVLNESGAVLPGVRCAHVNPSLAA